MPSIEMGVAALWTPHLGYFISCDYAAAYGGYWLPDKPTRVATRLPDTRSWRFEFMALIDKGTRRRDGHLGAWSEMI